MSGFYIRGLVLNPVQPHPVRLALPDTTEIEKMAKGFVGKPVYIEHDHNKQVGTVVNYVKNVNGSYLFDIFVNADTKLGKQAKLDVENGVLRSLSMKSHYGKTEDGVRHTDHNPIEISLVKSGAVDRSRIMSWTDNSRDITLSKSGIYEIFPEPPVTNSSLKQMSETPVPATKPGDAGVPATRDVFVPTSSQASEHNSIMEALNKVGVNENNVHQFINMVSAAAKSRAEEFTSKLTGNENGGKGVMDWAELNLNPSELDEFKKELVEQSTRITTEGAGFSPTFTLACSVVSALNEELRKGEAVRKEYDEMKKKLSDITPTEMKISDVTTKGGVKSDLFQDIVKENYEALSSVFSSVAKRQRVSDQEHNGAGDNYGKNVMDNVVGKLNGRTKLTFDEQSTS